MSNHTLLSPTPPPPSPTAHAAPPSPGTIIELLQPDQFDLLLDVAAAARALLVVDFHARWCRKCKYLLPRLRKIAEEHPNTYFATVDVNAVARLPREFHIEKMPTFIFFRDAKPVRTYIGGDEPQAVAHTLAALVQELSSIIIAPTHPPTPSPPPTGDNHPSQ